METQKNQNFWDGAEYEFRKAGETTIVDFFKELLPNEYDLEYMRHEQEQDNIMQKLNFRLTIEDRKKVLNKELELTINYLEDEDEGKFRHFFGDLSQVTLDKVISKIKTLASLIQRSSLWHELSNSEKTYFISIRNLKIDLIKEDTPFIVAYREILKRLNIRLITDQNKKVKPLTINRQLKEIVNKLFYDHFQVELNKILQEELKVMLEPSEINLQTSNSPNITKWKKDKVEFYQLIYALHCANYVDGEITKVVESLAPVFGIELSKNWQSGFTHNVQDNGKDYIPRIFENIEKSYQSYIKRRFFDK